MSSKPIFTKIFIGILAVVIIAAGFTLVRNNGEEEEATPDRARVVTLASVAELSREGSARTLVGEVRAESEAVLEARRGGQVTSVAVREGSVVRAGTLLAEVENRIERAAVAQATAGRDAQQASLNRVLRGARDEELQLLDTARDAAQTDLTEARTALRNTLAQSYTTAEDAIRNRGDILFRNPRTARPQLLVTTGRFDERERLQLQRAEFEQLLLRWEGEVQAIHTQTELDAYTAEIEERLRTIRTYLDAIARLVSDQTPDSFNTQASIENQKAAIFGARSSVDGAISGLSQARSRYNGALSALRSAQVNVEQGAAGALPEEIDQARAALSQAEAALESAVAQLEQTRIRAPITGTLGSLTISRGDIVSPGQRVGLVTSDGRPRIEIFISEADRALFSVGDRAVIESGIEGAVASIAPGLDPVTRRIRMLVEVTDDSSLVSGSRIRVTIMTDGADAQAETAIPITALRFGTSQRSVFTVDDDSRLVEVPVVEGAVSGSRVIILEGLSEDMLIVRDARGLREGQEVEVAE